MNLNIRGVMIIPFLLALNSCAGDSQGAGYWFHFIFVLIPLIIIGFIIFIKGEKIIDSLSSIEVQLKKLSGRLENLEEKVKKLPEKEE